MSKLLKSKFLLGVMVVAVLALGAVAVSATKVSAATCSITSTLRLGSTGAEVVCLQQSLGGLTADGKFGPATQAAVIAWQTNENLTADGVFGPLSNAAWMANQGNVGVFPAGCTSAVGYSTTVGGLRCDSGVSNLPPGCQAGDLFSRTSGVSCTALTNLPAGCTSTAGYSPTTGVRCDVTVTPTPTPAGPLAGTDGTIADMNTLSQYSAEEVGAGQKDIKVLGVEIEASKDGDIGINSIKVRFDSNGNAAADSDRIEDYLKSISIWQGGTKVGSADTSEFTKVSTGLYTKVVTLSDSVVRAGATEKFYVSVDAVSNLDSGDIDSDAAADGISLTFASFSTAADTELKISTNSTPDSQVIKVSTTNDTNNVTLLKGKFVLDGTSDVWLDELPITLTTTGDSVDALASSITLVLGDKTYTESLGANCTTSCALGTANPVVTFDNLDYTITAGDTVNFTLKVDLNNIEETGVTATDFDDGDTLLASLTATHRAAMVVENSQGDSLTDATERTG